MKCPKCKREWQEDSEQAACVAVYGQCIVCCVEMERQSGFEWSIKEVVSKMFPDTKTTE